MQENEKILAIAIGNVLKDIRTKTGKSLNLFGNEYDLPVSTLCELERGNYNAKVFSIYKITSAYGISTSDFFAMVEKELPKGFLEPEN